MAPKSKAVSTQKKETSNLVPPISAVLRKLYSEPLPSTRTGALYNAFSYPTKISPEAIALYIAVHTKPGDVVLDAFAGSGTTGLAALLCDKPTDELKKIATDLKINPRWGPRKAVLYEVGALGSFISSTMCMPPEPSRFENSALRLLADVDDLVKWMYEARDPEGNVGTIRHVIWSDVLICKTCSTESLYSDVAVKKNPLQFIDVFVCPNCKDRFDLSDVERVKEAIVDPITKQILVTKKREMAIVYGQTNGKNWQRKATAEDHSLVQKIEQQEIPNSVPNVEILWGDLQRNGYHQGITHIHHFYTRRNFLVFSELWNQIQTYPKELQNALRLMALSYNASHATLMTRVVAKKGQKDFVLTGAQSGILYISSLPVEKNIITGLRRKVKTIKAAFSLVYGSTSEVVVVNGSSADLKLKNKSIDYVFTDPPFGAYIPYAEISQINEAWIGRSTNRDLEIIISPSQKKNVEIYGEMMSKVFSEISRVLKDESHATLVFHSAKAEVWKAVSNAYMRAGLVVLASSVLDKIQASFKQVVSSVSVKGDPLLLLGKGLSRVHDNAEEKSLKIMNELLEGVVAEERNSVESTAERLYSRYITICLEMGLPVASNADAFYKKVREIKIN